MPRTPGESRPRSSMPVGFGPLSSTSPATVGSPRSNCTLNAVTPMILFDSTKNKFALTLGNYDEDYPAIHDPASPNILGPLNSADWWRHRSRERWHSRAQAFYYYWASPNEGSSNFTKGDRLCQAVAGRLPPSSHRPRSIQVSLAANLGVPNPSIA